MPSGYYQPINTSLMGDIGDTIASAITSYRSAKRIRDAWAESGGDYNKAVQALLAAGDASGAAKLADVRDKLEGTSRFGLVPLWDKQGNAYVLNSANGQPQRLPGDFPPRMNQVQTPQGVYPRPVQGGMPEYFSGNQAPDQGLQAPQYQQPPQLDPNTGLEPAGSLQPGELPVGPTPPGFSGLTAPQPGQPIPKDYTTPEAQKEVGDSRGKALSALPAAEAMTRRVVGALNKIETMPGLDRAVGPIQSRLPTISNDVADVEAMIKQAVGGVFTTGYESLRGAQAITDIEGQKATAAIARLEDLHQSDPGYRQALKDAKYEAFELLNIVRRKAGLPPQENPYPPPYGQNQSPSSNEGGWTDLGNGIRIRQK